MSRQRDEVGPRGGTTTRKRGQVQKTIWFNDDEAEALRKAAYERRTSEATVVREAVRAYLEVPD